MKKTSTFRVLFMRLYAFTIVFSLKTRVDAQKGQKMGVFRSQSGTAIVSKKRPLFTFLWHFFMRLNAFMKISVRLGAKSDSYQLRWLPTRMVANSDGYQVRWLPTQMATKSVGYQLRWLPTQLATNSHGYQLRWLPSDLVVNLTDMEVISRGV